MRYKRYIITELSTPSPLIKLVKHLEDNVLPKVGEAFAKKHWNVSDKEAIKIINKSMGPNITLDMADSYTNKSIGYSKYIVAGLILSFMNTRVIQIFLSPRFSSYFKRFDNPSIRDDFYQISTNEFFTQLSQNISHELIHIEQDISSKGKSKRLIDIENIKEYISNPHEIEAFAHDAALEVLRNNGLSSTMSIYIKEFGKKSKVFKRFMKKMIGYILELSV